MSFESLTRELEQGVSRFARAQQIGHDEAVLKLIEVGLGASETTTKELATGDRSLAAAVESRRKRNAARQANREALTRARPETPDVLIGYLADAPEVAENIRKLAYERRQQAFGNL